MYAFNPYKQRLKQNESRTIVTNNSTRVQEASNKSKEIERREGDE